MSCASTLPDNLMRDLLIMLEAKLEGYTIIAQNFIIQYTYFEFEFIDWGIINPSSSPINLSNHIIIIADEPVNRTSNAFDTGDDWTDDNLGRGHWVMKTFLDIGPETLKYISLSVSPYTTKISVHGKNPKSDVLRINRKLDMRNKSILNKIYACDLYTDFKPLHYHGKCFTR